MANVSEFVQSEARNEKLSLYHVEQGTGFSNIIKINFRSILDSPDEEEFVKEMKKVDGSQTIGMLSQRLCQLVALDETQLIEYLRMRKENERAGRQIYDVFDNNDPSSDDEDAFGGMFGN